MRHAYVSPHQGGSVGYHIEFREITHGHPRREERIDHVHAAAWARIFAVKRGLTAKPLEIGMVSPPQIRICRSHTEALCCLSLRAKGGTDCAGVCQQW